jgi:hypothetical protein
MVITAGDLLRMPGARLDDLYRQGTPGPIPAGNSNGTALIWAGTWAARPTAWMIHAVFWQGKIFSTSDTLVNKITPFGIHAIKANVYPGKSLFDDAKSIVLDYSRTSIIAWFVRDEIREIAPGLYLGQAYIWKIRFIRFAIAFTCY